MKKLKILAITLLAAILLPMALASCTGGELMIYDNADKYSTEDAKITDKVENIEIDWSYGEVNLKVGGDALCLSEIGKKDLEEDLKMHWWLDGSTLRVKFCASGKLPAFSTVKKDLSVTLPESAVYENVIIGSASAAVNASKLSAKSVTVSTASGKIFLEGEAEIFDLDTASGKVNLVQNGECGDIKIGTASGGISVISENCESVTAHSVSGGVDVTLKNTEEADIGSTSGKVIVNGLVSDSLKAGATSARVQCNLDAAPKRGKIESVSCSVKLILPKNADFTAKVGTVSGDFDSDFALIKDGNTYTCGKGVANLELSSVSGNISIEEK